MIFYFALILITLGILSLLFIAFSILFKKNPAPSDIPPQLHGEKPVGQEPPQRLTQKKVRERAPESSPLRPEDRSSLEKILRVSHRNLRKRENYWMGQLPDRETLKVVEEREPQTPMEPEEDPVHVDGVLFIDRSRQIHVHADRLKNSPLNFFQELKREGKGTLTVQGKNFRIDTANASHNYSASDLEQILFLQKGLALIPMNKSSSVPVFITDRPDEIKDFIKRHSRLRN